MPSFRQLWENGTLRTRVFTAVILISAFVLIGLLSSLSCDSRWLLVNLAFLVVAIAGFEFARFSAGTIVGLAFLPYLAVVVASPLSTFFHLSSRDICRSSFHGGSLFAVAALLSGAALIASAALGIMRGGRDIGGAKRVLAELPIAVILVGFGGSVALTIAALPESYRYVFWLVLVVSLNDSAAYFVGSKVGGPKLAPAISPGKTISGTVGGLAVGVLGGVLGSTLLPGKHDWWLIGIATIAIVIAAQVGDLAKSYLKRLHGVKDSGSILPGHGGILDRIDGILGGAPIFALYLILNGTVTC